MQTQNSLTESSIAEFMTKDVQVALVNDSIKDTVAMMLEHKLATVPVVDVQDKCVGMLSRADLTEYFLSEDRALSRSMDNERMSMEWIYNTLDTSEVRQVNELMTYDVTQIQENQSLAEACRAMVNNRIHHLPVVDATGKVTGIISSFDVVQAVAEAE